MKCKTLLLTLIALPSMALFADDSCNAVCDVCEPCNGWNTEIDLLFWKVRRSGLDYAIPNSTGFFSPSGRVQSVEPDVDTGYRIAMFKECGNCWDFGFRYASFDTTDTNKVRSNENNFLATRPHPSALPSDIPTLGCARATADYGIDFGMLDFEFGYYWKLSCTDLTIRPVAGLRFTSIDQRLKTDYADIQSDGSVFEKLRVKEKLDMGAAGLFAGFEGYLDLGCGLSLFTRTTGGLYAAEFDIRQKDYNMTSGSSLNVDVKEKEHLIISDFEAATGLQVDLCHYGCVDWSVQLGYEYHLWLGMADFLDFTSSAEDGKMDRSGSSLGLDGVYVRLNARY